MAGAFAYGDRALTLQHKPVLPAPPAALHAPRPPIAAPRPPGPRPPVTATLPQGSPTTGPPTAPPPRTVSATPPAPTTATPAPLLGAAQSSPFTVNPLFTAQRVSFTLSKPAHVWVRIAPPGQVIHVRTIDLGTQPAG